jgi:hypothetical protein
VAEAPVARNLVRIAAINTGTAYCIRPAHATAYVKDTIRFINLTGEPIDIELPLGLAFLNGNRTATLAIGGGEDVQINPMPPRHFQGVAPYRRWQLHYQAYRSKNHSLIPGESSPEIIIDEQP